MAEHKTSIEISATNKTAAAFSEITRSIGEVEGASNKLRGSLAGLGAGLSAAGFVAFFSKSVEAAASLDDLAEKTGASVEELSKLQQVARISGTDLATVESFLIKLNKALHETDEEGKGANRALEAIGLKAEELRGLDPAQAMQRVAVALNQFADGGGKTAAILALTGKSAAEALPFLKDLATETGIVSKVTAEQAAQAEELQKSIRRLGNAWTEAGQALARDLVPPLTRLVEQFTEASKIAGGAGKGALLFLGTSEKDVGGQINRINDSLGKMVTLRKELSRDTAANKLNEAIFGDVATLDRQIAFSTSKLELLKSIQLQQALALNTGRGRLDAKDLGPGGRQLDFTPPKAGGGGSVRGAQDTRFENAIKQLEQEAQKVQELSRFEEVRAAIQAGHYGKIAPAQQQRLEQLAAEVDLRKEDARVQKEADAAVEDSLKRQGDAANREDERLRNLRDKYIDLIDPLEKYRIKLAEVSELATKGFLAPQQAEQAAFEIEKMANALTQVSDEIKKTDTLSRDLFEPLSSAFEKAIIDGGKLSEVLRGLGKDFLAVGTRKLVTEPAGEWFSELLKPKGGGAGIFDGVTDFFKGLIPSFDEGTDYVPRTGLALVHQGERIIPAGQNRGGGAVYVTMNVSTPDIGSFRASESQLAASMARMADRAARRFG